MNQVTNDVNEHGKFMDNQHLQYIGISSPEYLHPSTHNAHLMDDEAPPPYDNVKQFIGRGCVLVSLITENLLMHPFLVLRRQCQVNPLSKKYHIMPATLIPVMIGLHQTQGLSTLWKGIGSVLIVRGLTMAVEDFISKFTSLPKEMDGLPIKKLGQHILLKCIAIGIVTPFYSASLVETVQSKVASENPGVLDVFRDGIKRVLEVRNKRRLISIYALQPPTIACGILKYLFTVAAKSVAGYIIRINNKYIQKSQGAFSRGDLSTSEATDTEMQSTLISLWSAEIVFYPLETIIQRLHLQGTRTIIDDLDTGRSVTAMLTDYGGVVDCYRSVVSQEGVLGLYKGFGSLIIQFAIHALVLKASKWVLLEIGTMLRPAAEEATSKTLTRHYSNEI